MASENVVQLTDNQFETEVIASDIPVLVDLGAEWCMPCRMIAPIVDELADEYAGKAKFCQVDIDVCREWAMKLDVRAVPTLVLFKDGAMVNKFVGLQQKAELKAAIDKLLV
ncbi:MAG: thioredoxin [Planctomycetes bacterium]|nr:thioredoxin [Planctomycetota bacterium]